METNIISVKYESTELSKCFEGKTYNYYSSVKVNVGDIVIAPTKNGNRYAKVIEINIPEENVKNIKQYLKTVKYKISKTLYLKKAS